MLIGCVRIPLLGPIRLIELPYNRFLARCASNPELTAIFLLPEELYSLGNGPNGTSIAVQLTSK